MNQTLKSKNLTISTTLPDEPKEPLKNKGEKMSNKQNTETEILTPQEAAKFLKVKVSTIYAWVHQRRIPYRRHGRLIRFEVSSLVDWSKSLEMPTLFNFTSS